MTSSSDLKFLGKQIILGVSGSIAAYKAVELLRVLVREGAAVSVVMTEAATRFVNPLTFEVLSRQPVTSNLFAAHQELLHLTLAERADLLVIAPATANVLAKCALGLADDLLSTMMLTTRCPVIIAPAMDGGMWDHPTVQAHTAVIRQRGVTVLEPEEGLLASGKVGRGRLTDQEAILSAIEARLSPRRDWVGQRVLVSAGPTQEAIDPVRFIGNRSSGKMGYALAQAARERGAEVILVTGPTALEPPHGVEVVPVLTAEDMGKALITRLAWSTVVVMAAAVADFRPRRSPQQKIKKEGRTGMNLELEPTPDILETLAKQRSSQVVVGFAAETEPPLRHAEQKLKRKGIDLVVGNDVTADQCGFGSDSNAAVLVDRDGRVVELELMSKRELADRILDAIQTLSVFPAQHRPRSHE
ncbi:bifunctional phosphopantothenoylcysteine decarboxylase/phosphopantothenate--cysteine ligase CoaBC [Nitrospiraceae bacterium AH_259_D15_M11_P09]|nr:bifunctional phosphopantothenoylcysteine decarboxylase/phosphopantothenate--cysteine ligase CoaBC [Nitrospiraceae bacterium AH_259_D15_M11_P09]